MDEFLTRTRVGRLDADDARLLGDAEDFMSRVVRGSPGGFSNDGVTAGQGASMGSNGAAAGSDLFLQSGAETTFNPNATTLTINSTIADDSAASLPSGQGYTAGTAAGAAITIAATNGGSVVMAGGNTYSGGTTLSSGILRVDINSGGMPGAVSASAIGTGTLTFAGGALRARRF
jgi:fibronectin-binding autotransporter adhesin